jgi:phage terminase large subunit-like protein
MSTQKIVDRYIDDILSGEIPACEYVKQTVTRHWEDLLHGHERGLWFNESAADKSLKFFSLLKHSKGEFANKPFILSPWQVFVVWVVMGWMNADGSRRFTDVYIEVARKNGKTTFVAALGLLMLIADGEMGAEVYTAATTKDQAKICFTEATNMIKASGVLQNHVKIFRNSLVSEVKMSKMQAVSSDANTLDGLNPHGSIIDEYHAHKTSEVFDVMKTGMGARRQPIQFVITTAGFNKQSPCFQLRKVCLDILSGRKEDDTQFAMIFTLDEGDDWEDPQVWEKANPNIRYVDSIRKFLEKEVKKAQNEGGTKLVSFLTKNLNQWVDASSVWIKDKDWQLCNFGKPSKEQLLLPAWGGLDLSSTRDITSFCLCINDKKKIFRWWFWIPESNYLDRVKKDGVNYDRWIREGYITATPGNVIDYDYIKRDILQICEDYDVKNIQYDRWNSSQLVINLQEEGIEMEGFGQGYGSMSTPTKEFEKIVIAREMNHCGNPVARWMISNVELKIDPAGNIKIDKSKCSEKVDGIVAAVMALGGYMNNPDAGVSDDLFYFGKT